MAFFDNSKKKKKAEEILASMNAPEIPANQPDWFVKGAVDMPSLSIFTESLVEANSWFNVEVAAVYVGNRIPPQCDKCDDVNVCNACGKSPKNYLKAMSANADGDYLVWTLVRDRRSQDMRVSDGIFTFFDTSVYSTFDTDRGFSFQSQKMVPVRMGTITVGDTGDGSGRLFIADAFAAVDSNDFITGVDVHPGDYDVVAWIGYTSSGEIAPMALGAIGAGFPDQLEEALVNTPGMTDEIRGIIEGSPDGTVFARIGNHQDHYAEINRDFPANNGDISWLFQLRIESDPDATLEMVKNDFGIDDLLVGAYALNMRGKRTLSLQLLDILDEKFGKELGEYQRRDAQTIRSIEAGFTPQAFHCSRMGIASQSEGDRFSQEGEMELALDCYLDSAMMGNPNALGSFTWHLLLAGKCQEAIDGFEQAKVQAIDAFRQGKMKANDFAMKTVWLEIANAESNYALAKLGAGAKLGEAIAIWEPNLETGHTETRFFLAMAQHKVGEFEGRDATLAGMVDDQWSEMKDEMKEMSRNANGFFKSWCAEGIDFVKQFKR
jgi:hypothetical protein